MQILEVTGIDDKLASEDVLSTFVLRVAVCLGLLGVAVESISSGDIGTRHWTGEQGAASVVAAEECPHGSLERLLLACRDMKGVLDSRASLFHGQTVLNLDI